MSWTEVYKMNEHARNTAFSNAYMITSSSTFTAPQTGYYKIICVGRGGTGERTSGSYHGGDAGGVCTKIVKLAKNATLSITVADLSTAVTSSNGAVNMTAYAAANSANPREADGGDYNYTGNTYNGKVGGSVGCFLTGLMTQQILSGRSPNSGSDYFDYGCWQVCNMGGGASYVYSEYNSSSGTYYNQEAKYGSGGVVIIPLGGDV